MNVVKLLGEATQLSDTPTNLGSASRVLLQHNHSGGQAHLVTVKNAGGTTLGSVYVGPHRPLVIEKEMTDTIEVADSVNDMYATAVSHFG